MMNFPSNSRSNTRGDADDAAAKQAKHRLQNDLLLLDGDLRKQIRLRDSCATDIRKDAVAIRRMEVSLNEKKLSMTKYEREIAILEDRIKRTKKSLNAIS